MVMLEMQTITSPFCFKNFRRKREKHDYDSLKGLYPLGKYMFAEYLWSNRMRYSQYIPRKFPMKSWGILPNNVPGILNIGIFPDCSVNILRMLHAFF